MRALTAGTNIVAPSSDYPKGRVKDKDGGAGTIGNEVLLGDLIQFFQKLVVDAGITENGNPDNVTNGYQLIDALVSKINTTVAEENFQFVYTNTTWKFKRIQNLVHVSISATTSTTLDNVTDFNPSNRLPANFRPDKLTKTTPCLLYSSASGGIATVLQDFEIGTTGDVKSGGVVTAYIQDNRNISIMYVLD